MDEQLERLLKSLALPNPDDLPGLDDRLLNSLLEDIPDHVDPPDEQLERMLTDLMAIPYSGADLTADQLEAILADLTPVPDPEEFKLSKEELENLLRDSGML